MNEKYITIKDVDTGAKYDLVISNPQFGTENVEIEIGSTMRLKISADDAIVLAKYLNDCAIAGLEIDYEMNGSNESSV